MNGSRERNNNFLLDGVDNNDTSVPGSVRAACLSADPDSTQEFRVITNNFNAEYGRNTGAIIDVVTKSGTNTFHGDAYEFGRWNAFRRRSGLVQSDRRRARRIPTSATSSAIPLAGRSSRTRRSSSSTTNCTGSALL